MDTAYDSGSAGWHEVGLLRWRRDLDGFQFVWEQAGMTVIVDAIHEYRGLLLADCLAEALLPESETGSPRTHRPSEHDRSPTVLLTEGEDAQPEVRAVEQAPAHLHLWRMDLWSSRDHRQVAEHLANSYPLLSARLRELGLTWAICLEQVRAITVREWRRPPLPVRLSERVQAQTREGERAAERWLVSEFLLADETNLLVGDRASGKSSLAAVLALCCATGLPPVGLRRLTPSVQRTPCPVLVLDWETTAEEWADRLHALATAPQGFGLSRLPDTVYYQRMHRPLVESARHLRRLVERLDIGFVIVDSALFAVSGEPSREASGARDVINTLAGLAPAWCDRDRRELAQGARQEHGYSDRSSSLGPRPGLTRLLLIHISKEEAKDGKRAARAYGSGLWEAGARCVWEARAGEDPVAMGVPLPAGAVSLMDVLLTHTKINRGRLRRPFGVRIAYDADELPIGLSYVGVDEVPELYERLSVSARILEALRAARGPCKVHQLAETTGADADTVSRTLRRLRARGLVCSTEDQPDRGRGKVVEWMLVDPSSMTNPSTTNVSTNHRNSRTRPEAPAS